MPLYQPHLRADFLTVMFENRGFNMEDVVSLLARMANTPRDHDPVWLEFVKGKLKLPGCYLPAAQRVISDGAWRRHTGKGHNPIGYVKTATIRVAVRMRLGIDRFTGEPISERSASSSAGRGELGTIQAGASEWTTNGEWPRDATVSACSYRIDNFSGSAIGLAQKNSAGVWRAEPNSGDCLDLCELIPKWLQEEDECDAVCWQTVARYAATKFDMVPILGKTLEFRFKRDMSKRAAIAAATSRAEARQIANAWKWVDRNLERRIRPMFKLEKPPEIRYEQRPDLSSHKRTGFIYPWDALRGKGRLQAEIIRAGPSIDNYQQKKKRDLAFARAEEKRRAEVSKLECLQTDRP
jgi:hypothetical protein